MFADSMPLDNMLYEITKHGSPDFPIQFYIDELYKFNKQSVPLHWHFESEFFVAKGGPVLVQIGNQQVLLNRDEGIFISSNLLHHFKQVNDSDKCQCPNIVFSNELIAPHISIIYKKYVASILASDRFPYFILHPNIIWQQEILDKLSQIFSLLQTYGSESPYGSFPIVKNDIPSSTSSCYEIQVHINLNLICQILYCHMDQFPATYLNKKELQSHVRLQHMLSFIQENYKNLITLQDISYAASISKSEASRCFHTYLNCSPVEYLLQYRISASQKLLRTTPFSVKEISFQCGFHSPSYFTKLFKVKVGITPGEYQITSSTYHSGLTMLF